MQNDKRETETKIKCVMGTCIKKATKRFFLSIKIFIYLCNDCFIKTLRQQTDKIKNELCKHEWHSDKDIGKNFCVHCEIQQPEIENEENKNVSFIK